MKQKNYFLTAVSNILQFGKGMGKIVYDGGFKFRRADGSADSVTAKEVVGTADQGLLVTTEAGGDLNIEQNFSGEMNLHKSSGDSPLSIQNSGAGGVEIQNNTGTENFSIQNNSDGDLEILNNGEGAVSIANNGGDSMSLYNSGENGMAVTNTQGDFSVTHIGDGEFSMQNNGSGDTSIRNASAGKIIVQNTSGAVEVGSNHDDGVSLTGNASSHTVSTANVTMDVNSTLTLEMDLATGKGIVLTDNTQRGLMYAADYGALTDLSLVHKSYVEGKINQVYQQGSMIVTDLIGSENPLQANEIRIGNDLTFEFGGEAFVPADGSPFTVAKDLTVDAGYIVGDDAETTLYADHIYIYNLDDGKVYDNGSISKAYDEKHVAKKMPVAVDASGAMTGFSEIPANAQVAGATVLVKEAFDGAVNDLIIEFAGSTLIDFSELVLSETAYLTVPVTALENVAATPTVSGSIDGGATGSALVLIEYIMP